MPRRSVSLLFVALLFTALSAYGTAQSARRPPSALQLATRALGARGRFQEATAAYREAASNAPGDPAIQTAWGDLFFEKYDKAEALKSFQMALQVDQKWVPAIIGSARALADDNPPQAIALA